MLRQLHYLPEQARGKAADTKQQSLGASSSHFG
jgi:hypothetical protein